MTRKPLRCGFDGSLPRGALVVALALAFGGNAQAESASFRWSPGCAVAHRDDGPFISRESDEYTLSEPEARSLCNAEDPVFIFGPNALSTCEIVPMAKDPEYGPAFEYRFSYRIPQLVETSLTGVEDFIGTRTVAFCRASQSRVVPYGPETVSAALQEAVRRSPAINGFELVPEAPWEAISSKQGARVVLVPVRWWDHAPSDDDPYLDDWTDRVPYVRLVLIHREADGGDRFERVGRLHPWLEVRNVADVDGDGYPEADILDYGGDGWEYWVSSLHPANVDEKSLWFKYDPSDWVRVGR